ncbi:MAG: tRNA(Glu)-specific nuclease WapA precursor, partial [Verrucomicrobiota bacterium]
MPTALARCFPKTSAKESAVNRPPGLPRHLFKAVFVFLAVWLMPLSLRAALISYDGADYSATSGLNGQNGGTGWFNAWSGAARAQAEGLVFPGLVTVGNRFVTAGDNLPSLRRLDPVGHELLLDGTSFGLDGTELWLSFLVRREPNFPAGCYGGLSLFNGGTEKLFVGIPTGATHWSLQQYDPGIFTTFSTAPVTAGETALLVLRLQFGVSGTQDRVELFVNPSPGVLPTTPAAVRTGPNLVFDRLRIQSGPVGPASPTSIDEIRLGENYADVTPAVAAPAVGWLRAGAQRVTAGAEVTLPLSYGWPGGDLANLAFAVTAANPALLPVDRIVVTGTGANRRVTVRPPAGAGGITTVTATVTPPVGAPVSASFELVIATPPPAGLLAHEPFAQAVGNLVRANGGTGFASAWAAGVPGASPNLFGTTTPALVFPGLVTTGARMRSAGGAGGLLRPTALPLGEDGTVRYLSLLVRPDAAPTGAGYFGLLLLGSGGGNLFAGKPGGGSSLRYVIENGGGIGQIASTKTVVQNEVALLVLKLEFLPGADRISLFVNPELGSEPATADAVKTDLDLGVLVGPALNGNAVWSADELRMGTTFASVIPSAADFALQRPLSENYVPEHVQITRQIQTVDPLPAGRTLAFELVGETFGATINPVTGEFTWVPGEDEQDQRRTFTVRVTSNATPPAAVETSFSLTVSEGNLPPQLAVIPDLTVTEGTPFSYPLDVSDPDRPLQGFNYSVLAGPEGFDVSTTGELKWSPTAAQLGRSFPVTVQVSDTGFTPIGRAQRSFTVTARARNGFFVHWVGGAAGGDWNDPANWDIGRVPNNSATEVFDVIWDDHYAGTIRVTGDIAVKSFTWSSEGTLSLPSPTDQFAVQGALRWTDGTLTGQGRLTVHGRATVSARRVDAPPILQDRFQLVFKSFCELESRLWCNGDVLVVVEPTATLGVAEGGGLVRLSGAPELLNEGSLRVWSSEPGVPFVFLRNRGRITTFAHTLRFQTGAANDLIQEAGGSLDLGAGVGAGATLNGKAVFLAGSTVLGDAHIREARLEGNVEGRLSFDRLSLAPTAVSRFELAAPRGSLSAIQPVTLAGRLELAPLRGFKPGPDQEFPIVTSGGEITGAFDGTPFGQRVNLPGGGSFLLTRSVDARAVVLGKYRPPAVNIEGDPLTFRLPDGAGELGGCFVAPHPAISLPEGDWAGGLVEVSIAGGNAFDRL